MNTGMLLTGARGQLGSTFRQHWAESALSDQFELTGIDVDELDLCIEDAVQPYLDELQPAIIINGAAYTAVDKAESEQALAYEVNEQAVANLARWCASRGGTLVQLSTDFVFDGSNREPYSTDSATSPLSVYGASKLAGELQTQSLLNDRGIVVRTSWLYSEYGNNFVKTMLRLMNEKKELAIVGDQIGSPTSTHSLARFLLALISSAVQQKSQHAVYHWTDGGSISWFEFAQAIQVAGMEHGILAKKIPLKKITTADYPTPAARPAFSVLDRSESLSLLPEPPSSWQQELNHVVRAISIENGN